MNKHNILLSEILGEKIGFDLFHLFKLIFSFFKGKEGYFHMPYDYIREPRLIHSYDGLWTVQEIRKRGTRQPPTVRQFVLSTNQTLLPQPPPVRQSHHHRHHHHHHHHRHKFL